jgi:hypothetical protein
VIKRIIRLVVVGWIVGMVVGAVAALRVKMGAGPDSDDSADEIVATAIFGPLAYRSTAAQLRGGALECWYGGGELDLRDATLDPAGATLRVRAIFGGGQILVPGAWRVVVDVRGLGGVQDARDGNDIAADAPTLTIEGLVIAGGFAVMTESAQG